MVLGNTRASKKALRFGEKGGCSTLVLQLPSQHLQHTAGILAICTLRLQAKRTLRLPDGAIKQNRSFESVNLCEVGIPCLCSSVRSTRVDESRRDGKGDCMGTTLLLSANVTSAAVFAVIMRHAGADQS